MRVHRGKRVVQQVDVRIRVRGARQRHAVLLAARQVHALLADLRLVARGQQVQVRAQRARRQHARVVLLVQLAAHEHVGPQRRVLDPWVLRRVRHAALHHHAALEARHLAQQRGQQRRLAGAHLADDHDQLAAVRLKVEVLEHGVLCGLALAVPRKRGRAHLHCDVPVVLAVPPHALLLAGLRAVRRDPARAADSSGGGGRGARERQHTHLRLSHAAILHLALSFLLRQQRGIVCLDVPVGSCCCCSCGLGRVVLRHDAVRGVAVGARVGVAVRGAVVRVERGRQGGAPGRLVGVE
mmetsp:Transcript_12736/g.31199  ORF Transcript_12736/g.31199 Transcript_12736/m.31199 type:complete len:296 (-) Transcript_12736:235-1122(-)